MAMGQGQPSAAGYEAKSMYAEAFVNRPTPPSTPPISESAQEVVNQAYDHLLRCHLLLNRLEGLGDADGVSAIYPLTEAAVVTRTGAMELEMRLERIVLRLGQIG